MRERDIRVALLDDLQAFHGHDPETLVVQEFGLAQRAARIDIAVVNGLLVGFEIKSEQDTLRRLPAQVEAYSAVFDAVSLVVAERHISAAIAAVPGWWGVQVPSFATDRVRLEVQRDAKPNPSPDPLAIAQLLWRTESLAALETLGLARGLRSKPRFALWDALARAVTLDDLRALVRNCLRSRSEWRAA